MDDPCQSSKLPKHCQIVPHTSLLSLTSWQNWQQCFSVVVKITDMGRPLSTFCMFPIHECLNKAPTVICAFDMAHLDDLFVLQSFPLDKSDLLRVLTSVPSSQRPPETSAGLPAVLVH